jgi:hypothetical protein
MKWCPCHGGDESVRCILRGEQPIVSIVPCGCIVMKLHPPLGRNEVWWTGKRTIIHEPGCKDDEGEPSKAYSYTRAAPVPIVSKGEQKRIAENIRRVERERAKEAEAEADEKLKGGRLL